MKTMALLIIMVSTSIGAAQKFYKWTDADGNTHYSSEKPEDKNTDEVKVNTNQPEVPKVDPEVRKARQKKAADFMEKHYEKKQKAKELAKINKQKCNKAQKTVKKFQEKVPMSRVNKESGETEYLEDSHRAVIIKQAQTEIKKYCS